MWKFKKIPCMGKFPRSQLQEAAVLRPGMGQGMAEALRGSVAERRKMRYLLLLLVRCPLGEKGPLRCIGSRAYRDRFPAGPGEGGRDLPLNVKNRSTPNMLRCNRIAGLRIG
jgi:hypothetical protein